MALLGHCRKGTSRKRPTEATDSTQQAATGSTVAANPQGDASGRSLRKKAKVSVDPSFLIYAVSALISLSMIR